MRWQNNLRFDGAASSIAVASDRAAERIGQHILDESLKLVPEEGGELADSAELSLRRRGAVSEAAISYDTVYAVIQHERLDLEHDSGEAAKYLEVPLTKAPAGAIAAEELGKALR